MVFVWYGTMVRFSLWYIFNNRQLKNERFFEDIHVVEMREICFEHPGVLTTYKDAKNEFDKANFGKDPLCSALNKA